MGKLKVLAAAVLNEDNPEFFGELMKNGVDAVDPEMKRQQEKRVEEQLQKDFEKAIRKRQANDKRCLDPKDVRQAVNLAIQNIIKENDALSEVSD